MHNQPLEMLQNYEGWQAETPTIILHTPGIQAKEHHTDKELKSLTLEALSVAYPATWARAYTDRSAEEAAKNSFQCGVKGNEEASRLSKMGSKLAQSAHPMSYSAAKTILRNNFRTELRQRLDIGT